MTLFCNFDKFLIPGLALDLLKRKSSVPCTNVHPKCNSRLVTLTYIDWLISNVLDFKEPLDMSRSLQHEPIQDFYYNNYYFIIKFGDVETVKAIVEQKCVSGDKHIIVLNIVEKLRSSVTLAMRSIINKYSHTAMYILINNTEYTLPRQIQELFFNVSIKFDIDKFCLEEGYDKIDKDPLNSILLKTAGDITIKNHLEDFIINKLTLLHEQSKLNKKNLFFQELHKFVLNLIAGAIPINILAITILKWKSNPGVVKHLADLDHKFKCSNKGLFAMEYYLQNIILDKTL